MQKYFHQLCLTCLCLLLLSAKATSQTDSTQKIIIDTAKVLADSVYVPEKTSSYAQVGFGVGNQLFSIHNHSLAAKQTTPPFVLTPTVGYFHKSGFSVTASSYMLNENKSFGVNQYAVTPAYANAPGSAFEFNASYTHYFINNQYSLYSSPIQNDLYSSIVYKKTWLQPGFALGYSTGQSKEVLHFDTTVATVKRNYYDSISNQLKTFSMIFSVQHSFEWHAVFNKKDSFAFVPVLMLNVGSDNNVVTAGPIYGGVLTAAIKKQLLTKRRKLTKLQTTNFEAESAGIDLQGNYSIGSFSIEPDVYLDYYLPQSTAKRFTQIFTVNFSYVF